MMSGRNQGANHIRVFVTPSTPAATATPPQNRQHLTPSSFPRFKHNLDASK
jgi:hypothetical protein